MIRNRLSILLAERNLKITKVAKDTGISRNTITSTAQNDGKMIQLETINALCTYLGVTPGDFFEYIPYDVECSIFTNSFDVKFEHMDYELVNAYPSTFNFDLFISIKGKQNNLEAALEGEILSVNYVRESGKNLCFIQIELDQIENEDAIKKFFSDLSPGFSFDVENKIEEVIHNELSNQITNYIMSSSNDVSDELAEILNDRTTIIVDSKSLPGYLPF